MSSAIDLTGRRFGRLVVKSLSNTHFGNGKKKVRHWLCACDCGNCKIVSRSSLAMRLTRSCGCLRLEQWEKNRNFIPKTHGMSGTKVQASWKSMLSRCYRQNHDSYKDYGGRGISACEFLRATPANLKSLIGDRPADMSLDRIDVNGNYSCGQCAECLSKNWILNVRWATLKQQARNTRSNKMVTINGQTKCVAEWAEISGVDKNLLARRVRAGLPQEELLLPRQTFNKN